MKAVLQRVTSASVAVDGSIVGRVGLGFLVLLGVEGEDNSEDLDWVVRKIISMRVFADDEGKMNLDLASVGGGLLVVSQFTLLADIRKGNRPSFHLAAPPAKGEEYYLMALAAFRRCGIPVASGVFGASMQISLVNDGPVTILVDSADRHRPKR